MKPHLLTIALAFCGAFAVAAAAQDTPAPAAPPATQPAPSAPTVSLDAAYARLLSRGDNFSIHVGVSTNHQRVRILDGGN